MSKVCHFEIQADNPERAMEFYSKAFGWKFNLSPIGQDYWMLEAGPVKENGLNGGLMRRELGAGNLITIYVDSIDEALKKVVEAGGKVLQSKLPVPGFGWVAYIKDTEGNACGLFTSDPDAK